MLACVDVCAFAGACMRGARVMLRMRLSMCLCGHGHACVCALSYVRECVRACMRVYAYDLPYWPV